MGGKNLPNGVSLSVSESPFLIYRQDKLDLEQQPERETEVEGQVLCRTQKVKRQDLQVNWKGLFFCFCFRENHGCTQGRFSSHYLSRWPSCGLNWLSVCWCSGSKSPWKLGLKSFSVYQFTASKFWESWELHRLSVCYPFSKWASTTSNHWDEHRTVLVISNEMSVCAILSLWGTL